MLTTSINSRFVSLPSHSPTNLSEKQVRKARLCRSLSLIEGVIHIAAVITIGAVMFLTGQVFLLVGIASNLLGLAAFSFSYWLAYLKPAANQDYSGRLNWSSLVLVWSNFSIVGLYYWLLGTQALAVVPFFISIGLALVLTSRWQVWLVTLGSGLIGITMYAGQDLLKLFNPAVRLDSQFLIVINLVVMAVILPLIVLLLLIPVKGLEQALYTVAERSSHLQLALGELENRRSISQQGSYRVVSLAGQLSSTATQQATGSQEQVAVVSQVGVATSELAGTASSISELAGQIDTATEQVARHLIQSEETTEVCLDYSQQGLSAVEQTRLMSEEVARLYADLLTMLDDLVGKNQDVQQIISVLNSLANETHLLSLNASIEAAGAGQYGERFGVVAQEVKGLANRSAEASRQIIGIVTASQDASQQARQRVQAGASKAQNLLTVASSTGRTIQELRRLNAESQEQIMEVSGSVIDMQHLVRQIKNATLQQLSATVQVREALVGLGTVAQQSAQGSLLISEAAYEMETLSHDLNSNLLVSA